MLCAVLTAAAYGAAAAPGVAVVSVADYGAVPDRAGLDSCAAFGKAVDHARATAAGVIRIPRGTYHFHWDACPKVSIYVSNTVVTPLPAKPVALNLKDLSNVVVEGGDSLLLMHGLMTPIVTDHCANVTVRDLAVDFPHPSVIEAKVLKVTEASPTDAGGGSVFIDIEVHPSADFNLTAGGGIVFGSGEGWALDGGRGYRPPNGNEQGWTLCQEYNPVADVTWRRTNPLIGANITRLPGPSPRNVVRLAKEPGCGSLPAVGNGLWFRDGGRQNNGIMTQYSAGVAYENVAMHFMSGFCVITQYTAGIRLHNVTIDTAEGSGRHCACSADLLHFSGCTGLVNVSAGRFFGSQDDGVNVHATHLQVVNQSSPTTVVVQFMQHESYGFDAFFPGDRVQFTRADSLEAFGHGTVRTAALQSTLGCSADPTVMLPCQIVLKLAAPLVGARLGVDVVENLDYTADVSITDSIFGRIPTRGILISTRGSVEIHSNTIALGPTDPHLHIADDAASWFESGPVADVLFTGNRLLRGGTATQHLPSIDVAPSNTVNATVHRNIRIIGNELHQVLGSTVAAVSIKSVAGFRMEGNTIFSPGRKIPENAIVSGSNCSGVVVTNNTVIA